MSAQAEVPRRSFADAITRLYQEAKCARDEGRMSKAAVLKKAAEWLEADGLTQ